MKRTSMWASVAVVGLAVHMSGRVLTPNGDGINDSVAFTLMSAQNSALHTQVFDVRGRRVAELQPVSSTQLRWDGKDYAARVVQSGVYLVQISENASLWNGVVAVA